MYDIYNKLTKIVVTVGPSSASKEIIYKMVELEVDVFRLNFSHKNYKVFKEVCNLIREASNKFNRYPAIMADLQGPKIRVGKHKEGYIDLISGEDIIIEVSDKEVFGNKDIIYTNYQGLIEDVKINDILLLDDGLISLKVIGKSQNKGQINCKILNSARLLNNKGINKKGGGLSADCITEKDKEDLIFIAKELDIDFVAISFVKSMNDIDFVKNLLKEYNLNLGIIAKLERQDVVNNLNTLESIIKKADCIMLARGDLVVEIGEAKLMGVQKRVLNYCKKLGKPIIIATQMMESMINNNVPTRAEIIDVANSVLSGASAIMLSAETANGKYPIETVKKIIEITIGAEKEELQNLEEFNNLSNKKINYLDEAISLAVLSITPYMNNLAGIACLTTSGNTARILASNNIPKIIYTFCDNIKVLRSLSLYKSIYPIYLNQVFSNQDSEQKIANILLKVLFINKKLKEDAKNLMLITRGTNMGVKGSTNLMFICNTTITN